MDGSILQRNTNDDIDDHHNFLELGNKDTFISQTSISDLMKHTFLLGTEKLLMARESPVTFDYSDFKTHVENEQKIRKREGKFSLQQIKKVHGKYNSRSIQSYSRNENVNVPKVATSSSPVIFPLNILSFLALLVLKLAGFQISLFLKLFTFPISLFHFWLIFLIFPFQTLARIRETMVKTLLKACDAFCSRLVSFVFNKVKMGMRFGKAMFCALHVFFVLVGLLVAGFAVSGFIMRNLVEEPIRTTAMLNFDYTKTSPVAVVPVTSSLGTGSGGSVNSGRRTIPYNHKMQLTVSLTMPESEYNKKLGVFQVRVESLTSNGTVITGSSYSTMLRFKSQPVRVVETLFKTVPLITGFQSEVQNLKIAIGEFIEGVEPTTSYKVILEQRAEFQAGSGVPEIYSGSLDIVSELPRLKRIVWNWRRTIFVWIGFASFMGNLMVALLFYRHVILLGRKAIAVGASNKFV